ncbi:hypothetical protein CB0940_11745 [Cercospora beticola]|uniref:Cupin type-2 domain-containing protein n=1 Tax=Cercospora beticola TaxID=122368 RepID=A0A2G5IDV9_CERBT|nr:hypothetical protein CB0940_11745 [Cercospora beticola]PIB03038.1 hypothetical protein CB0940_11745 [Cercospora beticola]WPB04103.1 hypothetical protein RHO25_008747 [Cercospora beticola]
MHRKPKNCFFTTLDTNSTGSREQAGETPVIKMPASIDSRPPGIGDPARRHIVNKVGGEDVNWLKYGYETNGEYSEIECTCEPGGGPPLHYHATYTETFTSLEGELILQIGDEEPKVVEVGSSHTVEKGVVHRFSAGPKGAKMNVRLEPASAGFEKSLYVFFGLANDGLLGKDLMPLNMLHTLLLGYWGDMGFPGVVGGIMNTVQTVGATYARWTGVEAELLEKYWK